MQRKYRAASLRKSLQNIDDLDLDDPEVRKKLKKRVKHLSRVIAVYDDVINSWHGPLIVDFSHAVNDRWNELARELVDFDSDN